MRDAKVMPLQLLRFFNSANVMRMGWDERGAYLLLLCETWLNGGQLPANKDVIKRILAGIDDSDFDRIERNVIKPMFGVSRDGERLTNKTLTEIYSKLREKSKKLAKAGKKGGNTRWKAYQSNLLQINKSNKSSKNSQAIADDEVKNEVPTENLSSKHSQAISKNLEIDSQKTDSQANSQANSQAIFLSSKEGGEKNEDFASSEKDGYSQANSQAIFLSSNSTATCTHLCAVEGGLDDVSKKKETKKEDKKEKSVVEKKEEKKEEKKKETLVSSLNNTLKEKDIKGEPQPFTLSSDSGESVKRKNFIPPTVEEVKEYAKSVFPELNAEEFVDFYTMKGWVVGKEKMRCWKAAVRTWRMRRGIVGPVKHKSVESLKPKRLAHLEEPQSPPVSEEVLAENKRKIQEILDKHFEERDRERVI